MDRALDLIAPLIRGCRVIGEDFATLQLENVGRCIDALPIALASVEIDDNLHEYSLIRLAWRTLPCCRPLRRWSSGCRITAIGRTCGTRQAIRVCRRSPRRHRGPLYRADPAAELMRVLFGSALQRCAPRSGRMSHVRWRSSSPPADRAELARLNPCYGGFGAGKEGMATPARLAPASQFPAVAVCDKPDHGHRAERTRAPSGPERRADPRAAALRTGDRGQGEEDYAVAISRCAVFATRASIAAALPCRICSRASSPICASASAFLVQSQPNSVPSVPHTMRSAP